MFSTELAVLAQLDPFGRLLLVLRRAVVAAFALLARHRDDVSHSCNPDNEPSGDLAIWWLNSRDRRITISPISIR
jgi:hypothetical protein